MKIQYQDPDPIELNRGSKVCLRRAANMDGIHDLGGRQGFGPVRREANEPNFHAAWEGKVFAMTNAALGAGAIKNIDQFRHGIERIDPVAYLTNGYYGRWLAGLETLLIEAKVLDPEAIAQRVTHLGGDADADMGARPAPHPDVIGARAEQSGSARAITHLRRFTVGDRVQTQWVKGSHHTRLPAYARGRCGRVVAYHDTWVLPDTNAHGRGECPEHLYTVEFSGEDLWGGDAEPNTTTCIDLFESYLRVI